MPMPAGLPTARAAFVVAHVDDAADDRDLGRAFAELEVARE